MDCVEGFDQVDKDGIGFVAVLSAKKERSFYGVLGFLASNVPELGYGFYLF